MLIAVYGSLKRGFWNYERFLADAQFLGESTVKGIMTMPMGYPYLFVGKNIGMEDEEVEHTVELYEVPTEIGERISLMELASGYYESKLFTEHGEATIFFANHNLFSQEHPIVEEYTKELLDDRHSA